ncbi:MAG: translation initiation factor IF-2, partial [bacterium]
AGFKPERRRPPKPKIPRIPSPRDYLKPTEANLEKSMEKLAQSGLRSQIDSGLGRGGGASAASKLDGKKKKRRRKIISAKVRKQLPLGGRGRNIHKQVQSQLDTSVTIKKRGRMRGRRGREEDIIELAPPKKIMLGEHVSIKDLSAQMGLKSSEIIGFLMRELEVLATINQTVDQDIAALVCDHFSFQCEMKKIVEIEDVLKHEEDAPEDLLPRPPVVTVLGHVDHGKTKLLDAIRGTDVVATEAGGITQKIGAFKVMHTNKNGDTRPVTFIDTPGHAAFTAMRARGAEVTDIAVLVVAANDGVMPQTIEAINHARSAGVEIVVAINKIDLPDANPERVKQQLSELGLVPEEWGGQIIMVPISAKKKLNIEELLENVLTVADVLELRANPTAPAVGAIIEAKLDKGRGPLATVLVKRGTLDVGDYVVVGRSWGRIRQMTDDDGVNIVAATPSTPALISGLNNVPQAGDSLNQVEDEKTAREIYDKRETDHRQGRLRMVNTISLEDFYAQLKKGEMKELNIILKADLQGSIEALIDQLGQLSNDEVGVKFIHSAVGNITDSDIMLAMASKAIILGFNAVASPEIRKHASIQGVDIRTYNIIYKAVEDIQAALEGMLEPEYIEKTIGTAEVRMIFKRTGRTIVAGCFVEEGKLHRGGEIQIMREGKQVAKLTINNLKRFKDDVKEVESGTECGIMFDGFNDLKEGDKIVAIEVIKVLRTLEKAKTN